MTIESWVTVAFTQQDTLSADFRRLERIGYACDSLTGQGFEPRAQAQPITPTRTEQQRREFMSDNQNPGRGSDKRKQSLYFPEAMLQEIKDEAARLDRSLSWIVQRAWKTARADIRKIPSVNEIDDDTNPVEV